ncbi:hypothetical protein [Streptomyces chartreusis]|uniref:Uncharacterized protein n=1 Tax=Streptomyces chartreusis TaxID=1969 RepID=A0A7I0Y904_STRCX|nr:hypothetical protein [Streptomyces chartreusis]QKZ15985.1 hypothetical protein HUT05_00320 [Streptomyces chartreusis]
MSSDVVSSEAAVMRSLLTARGLHVSVTGDAVVTVELRCGEQISTTASVAGDGLRWSACAGETVVYDSPAADSPAAESVGCIAAEPAGSASEGNGVPASFNFADSDMVWAADAVACYATEAERGTDLAGVFGGNLGQVLERAFQAHGITARHDGSIGVSNVEIDLPDGTLVHIWDAGHESTGLPAADYLAFGAVHLTPTDGGDDRETPIPLTCTGSLWGDLAVLIYAVKGLYEAVS